MKKENSQCCQKTLDTDRRINELNAEIKGNKREKEVMMATYCRLIKENERLHNKVSAREKDEFDTANGQLVDMLELKIQCCREDFEKLADSIGLYEQQIKLLGKSNFEAEMLLSSKSDIMSKHEQDLEDAQKRIYALEGENQKRASTITELTDQLLETRNQSHSRTDFTRNKYDQLLQRFGELSKQHESCLKQSVRESDLLEYIHVVYFCLPFIGAGRVT